MKKLFLITAILTPFASLALSDLAVNVIDSKENKKEEKIMDKCGGLGLSETWADINNSNNEVDARVLMHKMRDKLEACMVLITNSSRIEEAKLSVVEAELPKLEIAQSPEAQVENK